MTGTETSAGTGIGYWIGRISQKLQSGIMKADSGAMGTLPLRFLSVKGDVLLMAHSLI